LYQGTTSQAAEKVATTPVRLDLAFRPASRPFNLDVPSGLQPARDPFVGFFNILLALSVQRLIGSSIISRVRNVAGK
jgi:hypothetical protein